MPPAPDRTTPAPPVCPDLGEWLQGSTGQQLLDIEMTAVRSVLANLFGYHLLQIGDLGGRDLLSESRVLHRSVLELECRRATGPVGASVRAGALPIASDSVDVVLLPHVLEFESNPHDALREVERILVPEGHVVISGFNPWSLLGLRRLFTPRSRRQIPWCGHFLGATRLKDWLSLLGFDLLSLEHHFFRPPITSHRLLQRMQFMERAGARFWPILGGVYLASARKRLVTLTPIKPRWRPRRGLVAAGLTEPTTRTGALN